MKKDEDRPVYVIAAAWEFVRLDDPLSLLEMLDTGKIGVNAQDEYGDTMLHVAAMYGRLGLARILLARGADPNLACNTGGAALHRAAMECDVDMMRLLVERGANVDACYAHGGTALDAMLDGEAATADDIERTFGFLLEAGLGANLSEWENEHIKFHIRGRIKESFGVRMLALFDGKWGNTREAREARRRAAAGRPANMREM